MKKLEAYLSAFILCTVVYSKNDGTVPEILESQLKAKFWFLLQLATWKNGYHKINRLGSGKE